MPTPPKPVTVLKMEGKSHRTKKEISQRQRGEASTLTGKSLTEFDEVRKNPVAHKEYKRLSDLLAIIDKDDALYSEVINRYCMLKAECSVFSETRNQIMKQMDYLDDHKDEMEAVDYLALLAKLSAQVISYDRQIQQKRKMMFDIEKENIMTIAAALRSVPKQVEKKVNPLMEALHG